MDYGIQGSLHQGQLAYGYPWSTIQGYSVPVWSKTVPGTPVTHSSTVDQGLSLSHDVPCWLSKDESLDSQAQYFESAKPFPPGFISTQSPPVEPRPTLTSSTVRIPEPPIKELVGLGLYDSPDLSARSGGRGYSSISRYGTQSRPGKGLKLEETWQPPSEYGDDDADDASSDGGGQDEPLNFYDYDTLSYPPGGNFTSLSSRGLFEEEEECGNEWWSNQWTRAAAQEAGLGYGWI
ncbi:hypothetical protein B0A49_09084 [Cryomyces minteri]|uniref:Uncharacterized protein n=1 Tax=Cryomyces minteri TaxID=331657 RepID=A0A4U0WXQ4_9PEZI|nr:hypothetical protein B0A49_09084 [Cryomyces minteri]